MGAAGIANSAGSGGAEFRHDLFRRQNQYVARPKAIGTT
jgi:hypothetical protein